MDLGTSLINAFSFYNLGSPFFWITMLFPGVAFPYLVGWIFILKYVFAAVTAHLYLRRFLKEERFAVIGALLYAFSGFQSANLMFYHFHEVVAFFPLLLLALELVMEDRRYRLLFIFTVFLNCIVNYFFFIGEVVFLAVYFLVRFHDRPWKELVKAILNRVLDGAFGVCMAAVLFLPAVFSPPAPPSPFIPNARVLRQIPVTEFIDESRASEEALAGRDTRQDGHTFMLGVCS